MQAKADYTPSMAQPPPLHANHALHVLCVQRALLGNEEAKAECLRLTGAVEPQGQDGPKPPTIQCSTGPIKSARTHLEVFAKHSQGYMVRHGEWEVCTHTHQPSQSSRISCWQILGASIFWVYLSLNPWWTCCAPSSNV